MKPRRTMKLQIATSVIVRDALAFVLFSWLGWGCGGKESAGADEPKTEQPARAVSVSVQAVQAVSFTETLHLSGSVKGTEDVTVSVEEGGILKEWKVPRGSWVSRGEVIAVLKDDMLRPMYDAALAQYNAAQLTFERQDNVFREQGISEVQVKASEYARDAAKAQADLAKARWERTRITSPIDGILDDRLIDEGELVPPGSPLARIVNLRNLKAVINVPERYTGIMTRGTPVRLTVTSYAGEAFNGVVTFVGSAVVQDNRTIPIEVRITNARGKLKPDMIVNATILQPVPQKAVLVNEEIVQQVDQNTLVVYVEEGGKAVRRVVTVGARSDSSVQIVSGLKPGDRLIVNGYRDVSDGLPVIVQK